MFLRLARPIVYLFNFLAVIASLSAYAAAEYLPPAATPAELERQVQMIQSILPWSRYNSARYIALQNSGLAALRRQFPDFDKWAAEKPDPITIEVKTKQIENKMSLVLNDEQFRTLKELSVQAVTDLISENSKNGIEDLKKITIQKIGKSLLGGADSVRGLITGVLQVLPPEKRGPLFKAGEPALQLQMLRELNITDNLLRSGGFQGERFGLDSKKMTVQQVFALIESKLNVHQDLLVHIGALQILGRMNPEDLKKSLKKTDRLLLASDFGFVEGGENAFVLNISKELQSQFPKEAKLTKALEQALAVVPKQWFERKKAQVELLTPYVRIVEVHPYLAVYRGCIGGDCSTSNSPMYPYSPWEHVYYIVRPDGAMVGYITATRINAGGKATLYLKDISGPTLAPDMLEVILHALGQIYPYYKVQQFSLASHAFTDRENHFVSLQNALAKYNDRPGASVGPVVSERATFLDSEIRQFILTNSIFASASAYDSPARHTTAVVFQPQLDMSRYAVTYSVGTLSPFKPKTPRDSLIFALRMLLADEKADISSIPNLDEMEVRGVLGNLKNMKRLGLDAYYQDISYVFKNYGIELSRSFRQDFENFFIEGHLNARDAFTHQDATLRGDSERYFVTYCRRVKNLEVIAEILQTWSKQLSQSKRVDDLVELLQSRAEPADVVMLSIFSWAGIKSAQAAFSTEKIAAINEEVILEFITNKKAPTYSKNLSPIPVLNSLFNNPSQYRFEKMVEVMEQMLGFMGLSIKKIKNQKLAHAIEDIILNIPGVFREPAILDKYVSLAEKGEYPWKSLSIKMLNEFSKVPGTIPKVNSYFLRVLEGLSKSHPNSVEAALISWVVHRISLQRESQKSFSAVMLRIFNEFSRSKDTEHFFEKLAPNFHKQLTGMSLLGYLGELEKRMRSLEEALRGKDSYGRKIENVGARIASEAAALGISLDEFNKDPKIRKLIEAQILKTPESFKAQGVRPRAFEVLAEAIYYENSEYEEGMKNLVEARESLRGTAELEAFVRGVCRLANKGNAKPAVNSLSLLIMNNLVDKNIELDLRLLKELAASSNPFVQVFVAEKILAKDPKARFSVETLRRFASLLDTNSEKQLSDEILRYAERALNILLQVRTDDEAVQKELRKSVKEEDDLKLVLKAAIAYIKNGGSAEDMKKYVRRAFKDIKEGSRTEQVRLLRVEFNGLLNDVPSCKALF